MEAKGKNREMHAEILDRIWAIEDVQGDIYAIEKDFDKAMKRKIEYLDSDAKKQLGINDRIKFNLPNISDVKVLYKDYCWACENGIKCQ